VTIAVRVTAEAVGRIAAECARCAQKYSYQVTTAMSTDTF
jgi:hypothetical protein